MKRKDESPFVPGVLPEIAKLERLREAKPLFHISPPLLPGEGDTGGEVNSMYKEHELFPTPEGNNKIWRYMDFTEFVSLLDSSSLFFARLDKLGDPFEGLCPKWVFESLKKKGVRIENVEESRKGYFAFVNKVTAVNCWHLNPDESSAMWRLYLKSDEGIAIQSTVKRLKDSIEDKKNDIFITKVRYIDYNRPPTIKSPWEMLSLPAIYKRKIFRHDRELRAVIQKIAAGKTGLRASLSIKDGIYVPVNLNVLTNKIYMAPTSPKWQHELLESITTKYQLNKNVIQSSLDDRPLFKYKEASQPKAKIGVIGGSGDGAVGG